MSDLRETGQLEQDADRIIFLYQESAYDPECGLGGLTELIVKGNRHGANGTAYTNMVDGIMHNISDAEVNQLFSTKNAQNKTYAKNKQLDWKD